LLRESHKGSKKPSYIVATKKEFPIVAKITQLRIPEHRISTGAAQGRQLASSLEDFLEFAEGSREGAR